MEWSTAINRVSKAIEEKMELETATRWASCDYRFPGMAIDYLFSARSAGKIDQ